LWKQLERFFQKESLVEQPAGRLRKPFRPDNPGDDAPGRPVRDLGHAGDGKDGGGLARPETTKGPLSRSGALGG
jgi:hypothetical protein